MTHTLDSLMCKLRELRKITPGDTPVSHAWNGWIGKVGSVDVVDLLPPEFSVENPLALHKELVIS